MTYEQFWEQDCELVKYYRKSAEIKESIKNREAWIQGAYIYEALCNVAPILHAFAKKGTKPAPYRDTPYTLVSQNDKHAKAESGNQDKKAKAFMEVFMLSTNKRFQKKGGGVSG